MVEALKQMQTMPAIANSQLRRDLAGKELTALLPQLLPKTQVESADLWSIAQALLAETVVSLPNPL